jgi:hypothetical protein
VADQFGVFRSMDWNRAPSYMHILCSRSCIQISDLRLIFRNEQIFTQENAANLLSVGGVPNTRDDGRGIHIGPFKYNESLSLYYAVFFNVSLKSDFAQL